MKRRVLSLRQLYERQHGKCYYCREAMVLGSGGPSGATRDHVRPKARGGKQAGNLVAACRYCNEAKGNKSRHAFLNKLETVITEKSEIQTTRRLERKARKRALLEQVEAILKGSS